MEPFSTLGEIVDYMETHFDNPKALNYQLKGGWKHISTKEFAEMTRRLAYGLIKSGLKPGDKVGILANSSAHWTIADFAVIMAGGITVPLFANLSDESFIFEVAQSNVRFLFVEGHKQWMMYKDHKHLFHTVIAFEKAISLDKHPESEDALDFCDVMKDGKAYMKEKPNLLSEIRSNMKPDDLATIIYTSGSTGVPKGVELTHRNLLHLIQYDNFRWSEKDRYLSFLPLAHIFARQLNYILLAWGASVYYVTDLGTIAKSCVEVKPTFMIVVPRLLEKIYAGIMSKLPRQSYLAQAVARWAFKLAENPSQSLFKRFVERPLAKLLVYNSLMKKFGNSFRVIFCGGAALDPKLEMFFHNIGFPIHQGWGLTEASTITVNSLDNNRIGTVGPPLPGVLIKIAENGEVLVGGPTVMKGYYRRPEATKKVLEEDGWLHTGDKGELDDEGYLKLTGRIKAQFKLSTGEYVVPEKVEQLLAQHPLIDMPMVIGEGHRFASCLIFPDLEVVKRLKKEFNMQETTDDEFLESDYVKKQMEQLLAEVNEKINVWEKLQEYRFIAEAPTVESGELTPTLKIRRDVVLDKYDDLVSQIYHKEEVA